jgi:hypothetical protein
MIGPGVIDCKGGIAVALLVMKALRTLGYEKHLRLMLTSDEEVSNCLGGEKEIDFIVNTAAGFKGAFNCEVARDGEVVVSRKGILRVRIHITGKPSHSGIDYFAGVSAVREAAYKIIDLESKSKEGATTYNCGIIESEGATLKLYINFRYPENVKLEEVKEKIVVVALVDTLEYLKKGGRISSTVAFAGAVLNIKPVISLIDGEINVLGKARGSKQGNNLLVKEIEKAGGVDFSKPVLLGYTGITDSLLQKYIEDSKYLWEENLETVRYTTVGSAIGTHIGPGAIAVSFFKI